MNAFFAVGTLVGAARAVMLFSPGGNCGVTNPIRVVTVGGKTLGACTLIDMPSNEVENIPGGQIYHEPVQLFEAFFISAFQNGEDSSPVSVPSPVEAESSLAHSFARCSALSWMATGARGSRKSSLKPATRRLVQVSRVLLADRLGFKMRWLTLF